MAVCASCGTDNPDIAKFCMVCATPLEQEQGAGAEERKVVSVLFVDLVGFTARSHDADPEDVRAALQPYHHRLKAEIERFGGTVEKFIGDAVMAVFGAPVAHEDDAERAVRAALRITEAIAELNEEADLGLSLRAAVTTGEGLVNLSARPQAGEGMVTGDVVNTAARLQEVAPVNGVVVGEITYRSTKDFILYDEMEPVSAKGKPEPVLVWRAVSARGRFGVDAEMRYKTPFIGREIDLSLLRTTFQRTQRESSLQLITVVGEPGVGKSRLLAEFASYIDEQPELVTWRQGRSLPYGDGITFWALGEIVKAQAGINESDSPDVAAQKLATAVRAGMNDDADQAWVQARLAPLVGATSTGEGGAEKEESFTAWLRFFEGIAARGPLVLVLEDLHWADAAMLEFIEHVAEWSSGVPILIIGTARPELFEKHSSWAARSRNAATISLSPLTDAETSQLISALSSTTVVPAEMQAALLERAGGNPLYVEEFIRMVSDRGLLQSVPTLAPDRKVDLPMPDSVQALIAARLDTLLRERKMLVHNAAVVGKVFWSGAVASLIDVDDATVHRSLHELCRKELIRRARASSIEGEEEYSFWHALIRDVAYAQIPRAQRAAKHQAVAEWLEGIAGERVADHAEVLAYHYEEARELFLSSGMGDRSAALEERTFRCLMMAGDRAIDLDVSRALHHYDTAWRLLATGDSRAPGVLLKLGKALELSDRVQEAIHHFERALDLFRAAADRRGEAEAGLWLVDASFFAGLGGSARRRLTATSVALLEEEEPGRELAFAYDRAAAEAFFEGSPAAAVTWAEKGRAVAEQVGDLREALLARMWHASARSELGDRAGVDDLHRLYEEAKGLGWAEEAGRICGHLSVPLWLSENPLRGLRTAEEGIEWSERHGLTTPAMHDRAETVWTLYDLGAWDKILHVAREATRSSRQGKPDAAELTALPYMAQVLAWRQELEEAHGLCERFLPWARKMEDLQTLVPALAVAALVAEMEGRSQAGVDLIEELDGVTGHSAPWRSRHLPNVLRVLVASDKVQEAESFALGIEPPAVRDRNCVLTGQAIVAEARGKVEEAHNLYREAAERWADYGFVLEEGQAHLGLARCLIALGGRQAAEEPLQKARSIFSGLGAVSLIREVDEHRAVAKR